MIGYAQLNEAEKQMRNGREVVNVRHRDYQYKFRIYHSDHITQKINNIVIHVGVFLCEDQETKDKDFLFIKKLV